MTTLDPKALTIAARALAGAHDPVPAERENAEVAIVAYLDARSADGCHLVDEDPTDAMLDRAVAVAARTGLDLTPVQAHDIWQAMIDEYRAGA